ncbi:aminopeptidase [Acetobacterium woodii DSM 1030]|uniref:Aminopeptidase n=2 Tax=Acetobacterium woodii TaxID=33952 RepID=H6LGN7_ACEWD|nr:aminopeptidase [Acetobacterium woodii DSM 1030]
MSIILRSSIPFYPILSKHYSLNSKSVFHKLALYSLFVEIIAIINLNLAKPIIYQVNDYTLKINYRLTRKVNLMFIFLLYIIFFIFILSFCLLIVWSPGKPIPFTNEDGTVLRDSISEKIWVEINGVEIGMIIKSHNNNNPVLLFIHGGPGMPEYWLNKPYPSHLEDIFTVVWWDQRGSGLSYHAKIAPDSMTTDQFISDTIAVTHYLQKRFHQDKIYLMAHSFGTYIGIKTVAQAPNLYHAYFGIAQVVNPELSEELAYDFMLDFYKNANDKKTLKQLIKAPYGTFAYERLRDRVMHQAGIGTIHNMYSVYTGIFMNVMKNREYRLLEKIKIWQGKAFSKHTILNQEYRHCNLGDTILRLDLPVYFFSGIYDYTVNHYLSEIYLDDIQAP